MDDLRTWKEEVQQNQSVITKYYRDLFTSIIPNKEHVEDVLVAMEKRVTTKMNLILVADLTSEETTQALNQMSLDKAPRPDGYSVFFFQKFQNIVGNDVTEACLEVLNKGVEIGSLKNTFVMLIPKRKNPTQVAGYRPINLCNVIYKIITKALANLILCVLEAIISPFQSAFVPRRLIMDNIMVGFKVLNFLKEKKNLGKEGEIALKLDMNKAYDRVKWSFMERTMKKLGFNHSQISKIMRCISIVRYSFLINGEPRGCVVPSRGLRQGYPLSPYLFLIYTKGLSSVICKVEDNSILHGVKITQSAPAISHLFFVDESLVFVKADKQDCYWLKEILKLMRRLRGNL